jgi:diaminopimelate decarboxylase
MKVRVVGKHCESGDIIVADTWLPGDLRRGDLLAVAATGAYCRSMASSYNWVGRPPVIAVRDGRTKVVLRREGIADLLALDPGATQPAADGVPGAR